MGAAQTNRSRCHGIGKKYTFPNNNSIVTVAHIAAIGVAPGYSQRTQYYISTRCLFHDLSNEQGCHLLDKMCYFPRSVECQSSVDLISLLGSTWVPNFDKILYVADSSS